MSENKEEILANFQSITGIEDVGEAFSYLEDANWDLMTAIQHYMPQEDAVLVGPSIDLTANESCSGSPLLNNLSAATSSTLQSSTRWLNHHSNDDEGNAADDVEIIDLSADTSGRTASANTSLLGTTQTFILTFNIHFNQQIYTIRLASNATIEALKYKIQDVTKVPMCRQALRGWPPAKLQQAQEPTTLLSELELSAENELILIDLTEEGFVDYENDEVRSRQDKMFNLNIVQQPSGTAISLSLSGRTTIQEVKTNVFYITDIPVRHQEWTGWPHGCDNQTTLAQSGIELSHNFILQNTADRTLNNARAGNQGRMNNLLAADTDSSTDEFEDASDFNACEEFFTDSPPVQPPARHLIANNVETEAAGTLQFVENYNKRYGSPSPLFFTGSLDDALQEACNKPAKERKLLAIYLHHGESILTNVFCDHLLKHESILHTLAQNFILYGWDLTFESNKHLLLSSITARVGNTASMTVRNIPVDKLPSILIIGKSRLSGRISCEVLSVIHGNVGLDDLLSRLLESVEMYTEHLQGEIRDEAERFARDQVKAEQDMAYQETLQADMAKEEAKKQKEAAIAAERQRVESEKQEEDARRESIRVVAEQQLPIEPSETEADISKIRVRKPTGEFLERRFYIKNTLQDLLNYVASNGFLIEDYKLISSWPRRDLTSIDASQTLESLKLFPQETVILQER